MKTIEKLPEAELDVMLCLWRYQTPVRTAQLFADLQASRGWTLSTLKVLLSRLVEKEFVELTRDGRFTLYRALVSEQAYRRKETKNLVKRYYQNSVKSMIAALVREEGLSGTDLAEIEALVKKAGEKDAE
ncbi:MAG: BlaI/MecI/CopY family transcriptional regulator, partial [Ruthenibacterium sp.]